MVRLGESSQPEESSSGAWFDTMEGRPASERIIRKLGEGSLPDENEIVATFSGRLPDNHAAPPGADEPVPLPQDPSLPTPVGNPFGQMVQDMEDMKVGGKALASQLKRYRKLNYYAGSDTEQDAVNNDIMAVQNIMNLRRPDKKASAALSIANLQLVEAEKQRHKLEHEGAKEFASPGFAPVPDNAQGDSGPFGEAYNENLKMKRLEEDGASMVQAIKAAITPASVKRDVEPNKKERKKDKLNDDKGKGSDRSSTLSPKSAVAYDKAQEQLKTKENLEEMLHEAAEAFNNQRASDPNAKYENMVQGTALQGIKNFEAMSGKEKGEYALEVADTSGAVAKDNQVDLDAEDYQKKYDEGAQDLPFEEWQKQWTADRQANQEVNPDEEKKIREEYEKQKKAYLQPDIQADIQDVKDTHNAAENNYNMEIAADISEAPSQATIATMEKESIIGAKQLEEDTKIANARLHQVIAHPETFGAKKPLNSDAEINYKAVEDRAKRAQGKAVLKQDESAVLKDAIGLAESGSKADLKILDEDTTSALAGNQTMDENDKKEVRREQSFLNGIKKTQGRKAMKHAEEGVTSGVAKSMKAWNKVAPAVTAGAIGPEYGAAALKSLPTRSNDPQLTRPADFSLSGNTQGATVPLQKSEGTDDGADQMPQKSLESERLSVAEAKMEPLARKSYAPEDSKIKKGMTYKQLVKQELADESDGAAKEADKIEDYARTGKRDELEKIADDAAEHAEKDFTAADDDTGLLNEVKTAHYHRPKPEVDDDVTKTWDTKAAVDEINAASAAPVAGADDQDADEGVTASGLPTELGDLF